MREAIQSAYVSGQFDGTLGFPRSLCASIVGAGGRRGSYAVTRGHGVEFARLPNSSQAERRNQNARQNAEGRGAIPLLMERPQPPALLLDTDHCRLPFWQLTASGNGVRRV